MINHQIPLYTLLRDANSSQLAPFVGWRRVSSPRAFGTTDTLSVKISVDFSDKITSQIAADAQNAKGTPWIMSDAGWRRVISNLK